MQAIAEAMTARALALHKRPLHLRALLGVSHATRDCFDARGGVSNTHPGVSNTRPGVPNTHPGVSIT